MESTKQLLQEQDVHATTATTATTTIARRVIDKEWRYTNDAHLPPRTAPDLRSKEGPDKDVWDYNFKDDTGKVISGRGTLKQTTNPGQSNCNNVVWLIALREDLTRVTK
jgi:hypothetical protein